MVLLPVLMLVGFLLTGCMRLQVGMVVSDDDRVSGQIVVAGLPVQEGDRGPQILVPAELESRVRVEPYEQDGYVGTQLFFSGLTFQELGTLAERAGSTTSRYQLTLRRAGSLVTLSGSADLTQVPADHADMRIKIAFPGTITETNGEHEGDAVTWWPEPGKVNQFSAVARYSSGDAASWMGWVVLVGAGTGGVALLVGVMALVEHRRTLRREAVPS